MLAVALIAFCMPASAAIGAGIGAGTAVASGTAIGAGISSASSFSATAAGIGVGGFGAFGGFGFPFNWGFSQFGIGGFPFNWGLGAGLGPFGLGMEPVQPVLRCRFVLQPVLPREHVSGVALYHGH